ncbi:RAW [Mytilus edulis]|uniref:RAW n=1 Tax=Mytilus edulis TaxID=6550 RepID=A0A8S3ULC3_MYTED|nr:RAW [Mytilus edulis]
MGGILSNLTGSPETSESQGCNIFWGHVTRELYEVFRKYDDGNGRIPLCQLRKAFNEVHLYPSKSQIFEMVQCAVEYGSPCEPDHVTFGEFCILVTELKNHYHNCHNIITPKPKSLYREKKTETDSIKWKKRENTTHFQGNHCVVIDTVDLFSHLLSHTMSLHSSGCFPGGSCNPTTWRQELAIPFLKSHGITFYNPQVQNWRPELLELEAQAKENADIMFFVIDKETRGISSMIEVGYLVASMKQVILVLTEIEDNDTECKEYLLNKGKILEDLVERNSVPVFTDIDTALKCTEIVLNQGLRVQDLDLQHGAQPVIHGHIPVGETLLIFSGHSSSSMPCHSERLQGCIFRGQLWDSTGEIRLLYQFSRKNGISYVNPFISGYNQKLIPIQVQAREKCRLLLYVITDRTRSLSSMIEVCKYMKYHAMSMRTLLRDDMG